MGPSLSRIIIITVIVIIIVIISPVVLLETAPPSLPPPLLYCPLLAGDHILWLLPPRPPALEPLLFLLVLPTAIAIAISSGFDDWNTLFTVLLTAVSPPATLISPSHSTCSSRGEQSHLPKTGLGFHILRWL